MSRIVRVATTSLATLEDTAPPFNLRHPDPAANLALGLSLLEAAGARGVDLACLPETFTTAGLPGADAVAVAQEIPGPAFDAVAAVARRHHMYVVAGLLRRVGDRVFNVAALIDRAGRLVTTYAKRHPTGGEIDCGVTPGQDAVVVDTDFGRLGLAVCFDINWPALWTEMAGRRAEIVCWLSAYEGGLPLQAYAWQHRYPIVTSVWPYHARVIDVTGRILASTSRWGRVAFADLDLERRLFHTDNQADRILAIQTRYGPRVRIETLTEEHLFTLASSDAALPVSQIIEEFGLTDYETYIAECTTAQAAARSGLALEKQA